MKITSQLVDEVFSSEEWHLHVSEWMLLRVDVGQKDELDKLVAVLETAAPFTTSKVGIALVGFNLVWKLELN